MMHGQKKIKFIVEFVNILSLSVIFKEIYAA